MPTPKPITVVVSRFDDLLQGGLRALLDGDESIQTVAAGVAHDRLSVVLKGHQPDVAIIDASALARLVEIREIVRAHPWTKLVLLGLQPSAAETAQALAFGASAYLDIATQNRDVLSAVHLASRGLRLTPVAPLNTLPESDGRGLHLTRREADVLPLLREGRSNAEIALNLGVGVETVRTHTRNIYKKLGVSSRRELLEPIALQGKRTSTPVLRQERWAGARSSTRRGGHEVRSR